MVGSLLMSVRLRVTLQWSTFVIYLYACSNFKLVKTYMQSGYEYKAYPALVLKVYLAKQIKKIKWERLKNWLIKKMKGLKTLTCSSDTMSRT